MCLRPTPYCYFYHYAYACRPSSFVMRHQAASCDDIAYSVLRKDPSPRHLSLVTSPSPSPFRAQTNPLAADCADFTDGVRSQGQEHPPDPANKRTSRSSGLRGGFPPTPGLMPGPLLCRPYGARKGRIENRVLCFWPCVLHTRAHARAFIMPPPSGATRGLVRRPAACAT
jgi:hypothetical protein